MNKIIFTDGKFLSEDAEDRIDIVNNLTKYARQTELVYLFCYAEKLLSSSNVSSVETTKEYFSLVLAEYPEFFFHLIEDNGYALLEFPDPFYAVDFAETYFLYGNEVDMPEKHIYCCVVGKDGAIYFENLKRPKLEPPVKIPDPEDAELL